MFCLSRNAFVAVIKWSDGGYVAVTALATAALESNPLLLVPAHWLLLLLVPGLAV